MATTTNYGWTTPNDTDLVKDGASAIRSLGTAIDTTVYNNANAAIAKTIVDAKGDIVAATAADTVSRLGVGANNTVLTADSTTATGLKWATPASGSMTLISTTSLSGSSISVSSISGTYKSLKFYIKDFTYGSGEATLQLRFNNDSGSNYLSSQLRNNDGTASTGAATGTAINLISPQQKFSAANFFLSGQIDDYANATTFKTVVCANTGNEPDNTLKCSSLTLGGWQKSPEAITEINLSLTASTFSTGTLELYGVN